MYKIQIDWNWLKGFVIVIKNFLLVGYIWFYWIDLKATNRSYKKVWRQQCWVVSINCGIGKLLWIPMKRITYSYSVQFFLLIIRLQIYFHFLSMLISINNGWVFMSHACVIRITITWADKQENIADFTITTFEYPDLMHE